MSAARFLVHGVMRAPDSRRLSLAALPFGDLAAVLSPEPESEGDDAARTLALAERHHAILSGIAEAADILPVRLGAAFADADTAARALAEMADLFRARLDVCADAVELALVVEDLGAPPAPPAAAAGGKDYLKARAAALSEARSRPARVAAALEALEADLTPLSRARVRRPPAPPRALDLAWLVQRCAISTVSNRIRQWEDRLAALGLAASLRGPWPVYSFASLSPASLS